MHKIKLSRISLLWLSCWLALSVPILNLAEDEGACANKDSDDSNTCTNREEDVDRFLLPQCGTNRSQTALALEMANTSSPKGSPSHIKLLRILDNHQTFFIDLGGHQKLFDAVTENMVTALEGYGLQQIATMDHHYSVAADVGSSSSTGRIKVETLFSQTRRDKEDNFYMDLPNTAVIIIQTEQICCSHYGKYAEGYLNKCHQSPNCILWEYSHLNYEWLVEKGWGDSVILLPTLLQHRLDPYYNYDDGDGDDKPVNVGDSTTPSPDEAEIVVDSSADATTHPNQRTIDVVFFGVMTQRRQQIQMQLQQIASQQNWNMIFEEVDNSGSRLDYMADIYSRSKICLIVHSFVGEGGGVNDDGNSANKSPGEYHRLSEMAPSGCLPVVETFGDDVGVEEYYRQCGGVIFSGLSYIPTVIQTLLTNNYDNDDKMQGRIEWWAKSKVDWEHLLQQFLND